MIMLYSDLTKRLVRVLFLTAVASTSALAQVELLPTTYIRMRPLPSVSKTQDSTIAYPIFHLRDKRIEQRINATIKQQSIDSLIYLMTPERKDLSLREALGMILSMGVEYVEADSVVVSQGTLLSLMLLVASGGPCPAGKGDIYCFDLESGERLSLRSLIEPTKWSAFEALLTVKTRKAIHDEEISFGLAPPQRTSPSDSSVVEQKSDMVGRDTLAKATVTTTVVNGTMTTTVVTPNNEDYEAKHDSLIVRTEPYSFYLRPGKLQIVVHHKDPSAQFAFEEHTTVTFTRTELMPMLKAKYSKW